MAQQRDMFDIEYADAAGYVLCGNIERYFSLE